MWPFRRRRDDDAGPSDAGAAPVGAQAAEPRAQARLQAWPSLPPLQRTIGEPPHTYRTDEIGEILTSWRNPMLSGELGHQVSPAAPSGVIHGLVTTASTAPEPVPAPPAGPAEGLTLRDPVRPSPAELPMPHRSLPASPSPAPTVSRVVAPDVVPPRPLAALPALPLQRAAADGAGAPAPPAATNSLSPPAAASDTPAALAAPDASALSYESVRPAHDFARQNDLEPPLQPRALQRRAAASPVPPASPTAADGAGPGPAATHNLPLASAQRRTEATTAATGPASPATAVPPLPSASPATPIAAPVHDSEAATADERAPAASAAVADPVGAPSPGEAPLGPAANASAQAPAEPAGGAAGEATAPLTSDRALPTLPAPDGTGDPGSPAAADSGPEPMPAPDLPLQRQPVTAPTPAGPAPAVSAATDPDRPAVRPIGLGAPLAAGAAAPPSPPDAASPTQSPGPLSDPPPAAPRGDRPAGPPLDFVLAPPAAVQRQPGGPSPAGPSTPQPPAPAAPVARETVEAGASESARQEPEVPIGDRPVLGHEPLPLTTSDAAAAGSDGGLTPTEAAGPETAPPPGPAGGTAELPLVGIPAPAPVITTTLQPTPLVLQRSIDDWPVTVAGHDDRAAAHEAPVPITWSAPPSVAPVSRAGSPAAARAIAAPSGAPQPAAKPTVSGASVQRALAPSSAPNRPPAAALPRPPAGALGDVARGRSPGEAPLTLAQPARPAGPVVAHWDAGAIAVAGGVAQRQPDGSVQFSPPPGEPPPPSPAPVVQTTRATPNAAPEGSAAPGGGAGGGTGRAGAERDQLEEQARKLWPILRRKITHELASGPGGRRNTW